MFIIDDILSAVGANKAAKAQEQQAREAMDLQRQTYGQQRADQSPYMDAGRSTLAQLMQQMTSGGFSTQMDPNQLANDPGFQFRMAQGQKALERSAAARGGLMGGGFAKGLARYSQGVASDEFNNAWNRQNTSNNNRFNQMFSLAGMGQGATQNMNAQAGQYANSMGDLYGAIGNARAAGINGTWGGAASGLRSAANIGMMIAGVPPVGAMGGGGGGGGAIPTQGTVGSMNLGRGGGWGPNSYGG